MIIKHEDVNSQDILRIGFISLRDGPGNIGCLIWDATPFWADIQVSISDTIPDHFHINISELDIDCDCDVVARNGCNLRVRLLH